MGHADKLCRFLFYYSPFGGLLIYSLHIGGKACIFNETFISMTIKFTRMVVIKLNPSPEYHWKVIILFIISGDPALGKNISRAVAFFTT